MRPDPIQFPCCRRLNIEHLEPRLTLSGSGLTAQYFFNSDFTGVAGDRTETVSQNWGTLSPGFGIAPDNFSVRWTGQIEAVYSQSYTFRLTSDGGARLWLDGRLLIDDWTSHVTRSAFGTVSLTAGQRYDVRVDYFDDIGNALIDLSWSSASQVLQTVPAARLYESPSGLLGTYRDSSGGNVSRVDAGINFNWGTGSPIAGIAADNFTVSWTGQIRADFADDYSFTTTSDDGVRLWIDNDLVIDDYTTHSATQDTGDKWLEPGKWCDFRLDYFEATGTSQIVLRWSSSRQTGGALQLVPQTSERAALPEGFDNPLGPGADPWVTYYNGYYYMSRSQGNAVWINRAARLEDVANTGGHTQSIQVWSAPVGTDYSKDIWAPELHHMGANWYIYVAADDGNNANHRMQVLERLGDDPFGAFTRLGVIAADTDRWAIDGTVFKWNNTWYMVWSGWSGTTNTQQNLYIAQMRDPWTLASDRVLISSPQYSWEKNGLPINEGPEALIHNGQLYIIYSASGYWTNQYALGRLTYNGTGSLLDASSWTKTSQPVFQATSQVAGPGHASFTTSPDGNENWIVYHAHANPTTFNEDRVIRIQPFTFNGDGTPNFGKPVPPGQLLAVPSPGPDPERPIVVGDYQADGMVDQSDYNVWRATFGATVFPGSAADGNGNGVIDAADYVRWRQASVSALNRAAIAEGTASLDSTDSQHRELVVEPSAGSLVSSIVPPTTNRLNVSIPELASCMAPTATRQRPQLVSRLSPDVHVQAGWQDDALIAWLSSRIGSDPRFESDEKTMRFEKPDSANDAAGMDGMRETSFRSRILSW